MGKRPFSNASDEMSVLKARHQALVILRVLSVEGSGICNDALLRDFLEVWGLWSSREEIRVLLDGLSREGALTLREQGGIIVVQLTEKGEDLARGRARSDLVLRSLPCGDYDSLGL